jgi:hypothetical protein
MGKGWTENGCANKLVNLWMFVWRNNKRMAMERWMGGWQKLDGRMGKWMGQLAEKRGVNGQVDGPMGIWTG